jgi:hypothetical protein
MLSGVPSFSPVAACESTGSVGTWAWVDGRGRSGSDARLPRTRGVRPRPRLPAPLPPEGWPSQGAGGGPTAVRRQGAVGARNAATQGPAARLRLRGRRRAAAGGDEASQAADEAGVHRGDRRLPRSATSRTAAQPEALRRLAARPYTQRPARLRSMAAGRASLLRRAVRRAAPR